MESAERDCELALAAHWSQLGRIPGGTLEEDDRLVWFRTPMRRLPFNGVVRSRLDERDADTAIRRITADARERGAELWWAQLPSATPADLGDRLAAAGLFAVEQMNFMYRELADWSAPPPPPGVEVRAADGPEDLRDYTDLTVLYWEVPESERETVAELHRWITPDRIPGQRFLARIDGRPVGKAYLSWPGPPAVASLYGMSVVPEARGRGVAAALTSALLTHARARGFARMVLHATDMAVGVYERAGFRRCGTATIWATADIWSSEA